MIFHHLKKETWIKLSIIAGVIVLAVVIFWEKAYKEYFLWGLTNNMYDDDNEIPDMVNDIARFKEKIIFEDIIPVLIERINPEVNNGMPGRRIAEGVLEILTSGDFEPGALLEFEHTKGQATEIYEDWFNWWEENKSIVKWNPVTKTIDIKEGN
ncbi:hypothetical protein ACFL54_08200 [Planctomycetota bacterium]